MKEFFAALIIIVMIFNLAVFAEEPSEWAKEEIFAAIERGYVPEGLQKDYALPITRAEFAVMAVKFVSRETGYEEEEFFEKAASLSDGISFIDTDDKYILAASQCGIIYGVGEGKFEPARSIKREEAAAMLARVYNCYGNIYSFSNIQYEDNNLISHWALSDVKFCVSKEIMKGISDTLFDPQGLYTKEQSIATFFRLDSDTDWENHNKTAKIRRKMTKEIAKREYETQPMRSIVQQYDTEYGVVYYSVMGGMMHAPGYSLDLIDNDGNFYSLDAPVPSGYPWRYVPQLENLRFSYDNSLIAFEVTYGEDMEYDGKEIHKAGTYYFEANLMEKETKFLKFLPNDTSGILEKAVQEYIAQNNIEVIDRIDTGDYGTLLYVKTDTEMPTEIDDRYILVLIGNDGKSHLLSKGPVLSTYGQVPPLENITLSEYNSVVSFERHYTLENIASSPDIKEPGIYYGKVNLITLEIEEKFISE